MIDKVLSVIYRWMACPPLGAGLRSDTADLHKRYPTWYTYTATASRAAEHFPALAGRLRVLVGASLSELQKVAEKAAALGIPYEALGYALERSSPEEEWTQPEQSVTLARDIADLHEKGLLLGLGGRLADDIRAQWCDLAALCDFWIIQAQRQQENPAGRVFRREVAGRARALARLNPQMRIIVQVSTTPGPYQLEPAAVFEYVRWLTQLPISAVSIFDGRDPRKPETLRQVLALRYKEIARWQI